MSFDEIMQDVRIEKAENRIREMHNATCKTCDIMAYESIAFIRMIVYTQGMLRGRHEVREH